MTKLVVDANVVIKWFVHEPLSVEARRILDEYQADTLWLLAPDLILRMKSALIKTSKTRILFLLMGVALLSGTTRAQATDVVVAFREDGVKKELAYRVKLSINGKEMEPQYSDKGFVRPRLEDQKTRVKVAFCDKVVDFGEVDRGLFETEWVVGIDNKPYEKANVGHLPGPMREQGDILYYIEFMSGGLIKYKITVFK